MGTRLGPHHPRSALLLLLTMTWAKPKQEESNCGLGTWQLGGCGHPPAWCPCLQYRMSLPIYQAAYCR